MEQGLAKVATREDGLIKTHVPVVASFRPRMTMLRALAVRTGHSRCLRIGGGVRKVTGEAVRAAKWESTVVAQDALDVAYREWARMAEEELRGVTGAALPKAGLRGMLPHFVWRTIVPERVKENGLDARANECRRRRALLRQSYYVGGCTSWLQTAGPRKSGRDD